MGLFLIVLWTNSQFLGHIMSRVRRTKILDIYTCVDILSQSSVGIFLPCQYYDVLVKQYRNLARLSEISTRCWGSSTYRTFSTIRLASIWNVCLCISRFSFMRVRCPSKSSVNLIQRRSLDVWHGIFSGSSCDISSKWDTSNTSKALSSSVSSS